MKKTRSLILIAVAICSGLFLYPTIKWYFFLSEEEKNLAVSTDLEIRNWVEMRTAQTIAQLQTLAVQDSGAPVPQDAEYIINSAREIYRAEDRVVPREWTISQVLSTFAEETLFALAIEEHFRNEIEDLRQLRSRIILPGLDLSGGLKFVLEADDSSLEERLGQQPTAAQTAEAVDLAIDILSNRIDRFGITEPQIRRIDDTNISVEIPGNDDRRRVNEFLIGKGRLNFHVVDETLIARLDAYLQQSPQWSLEQDEVPDFIPAGSSIIEYSTRDEYGIDQFIRYITIKDDVIEHGLDGSYITEAQYGTDPLTTLPIVNFILDREGSNVFAKLTRDNIGGSLAIVLDGIARAYVRIPSEIPNGQAQISGFDEQEARAMARVLRTAALPIDLQVTNMEVVGAQLGQEAVSAGLRAITLGFILVIAFMFVYYKGAGLIADIMLILNLFIVVATLSVFNLTLTLTSIAGIILTVGMAVDANVIIFERIKEEYRLGKGRKVAIRSGYKKAFWTILDANVTTFIAALFLSQFGSGPVRGFAVTLSVGIVTSMFTSLFVSRLIFDVCTDLFKRTKLSIGWKI